MKATFRYVLASALLLAFCCSLTIAQKTPAADGKSSNSTASQKKKKVSLTPGRQAAAMTFAKLHHPELADLLSHLKKHNRPEYRVATRELYQTSEKLAKASERWPEKHALDLEAWKLDSRIRLMLAHIMVSDNSALEGGLEKLLLERVDIQVRQMTLQRDRLAQQQQRLSERKEKLDVGILRIESDRKAAAKKALSRIKNSLKARSGKRKKT